MEINPKTGNIMVALPKGLKADFDRYMFFHPPKFGVKTHVSNFYYIFSKIYAISKGKARFKNLDKVPISSKIIMHEIGRHYRKYLDYLIGSGFLETDNHYIVGTNGVPGKCKCYGINDKFKNVNDWEMCEINSKSVIGHFMKWKSKMFSDVASDEMLGKLYDMVQEFSIDTEAAEEYLNRLKSFDPEITDEWIKNEMTKCHRINEKTAPEKMMFMVKDAYGRIHTNLTNLSKHIRERFLYMNGKPVKSLDIVSSQASLLYNMMRQHVEKTKEHSQDLLKTQHQLMPYFNHFSYPKVDMRDKYVNARNRYTGDSIFYPTPRESDVSTLGYSDFREMIDASERDLNKMETVLKTGIYEFFMDRWHFMYKEKISRDKIKKKWIRYVFGKPEHGETKIRDIWHYEFPALERMIDHFKIEDHRVLSHTLQRTESDIIFNKVCKAIDTQIGTSYGTVHDSIIIPEEHYDAVKAVFSGILVENGIVTGVK